MTRTSIRFGRTIGLTICLAAWAVGTKVATAQIAVRAKTIHTMAGAPIDNGMVVIQDGKITAIGRADQIAVPQGFRVLDRTCLFGYGLPFYKIGLAVQLYDQRDLAVVVPLSHPLLEDYSVEASLRCDLHYEGRVDVCFIKVGQGTVLQSLVVRKKHAPPVLQELIHVILYVHVWFRPSNAFNLSFTYLRVKSIPT